MSFIASWESTQVILASEAVSLLAKDFADTYDNDTLERLLLVFKDMKTPFYVEKEASMCIDFDPDLPIHQVSYNQISDMLARSSHSLVF